MTAIRFDNKNVFCDSKRMELSNQNISNVCMQSIGFMLLANGADTLIA